MPELVLNFRIGTKFAGRLCLGVAIGVLSPPAEAADLLSGIMCH